MEKIIQDFGIEPVLLGAQIINFLILLLLLKRFLYKPLLKVLDERKQKIAAGLKAAEENEQLLLKTETDREKQLSKASLEAKSIIEEAKNAANEIVNEAHLKAAADIEALLAKTHQQIQVERVQLQNELRSEFADIVVASLEKIAEKSLNPKDRQKITKEAITQLR